MLRKLVCALFAWAVCVGFVLADDVTGKIKSVVTGDKPTITITVDGTDQTFKISKTDTKFMTAKNKDLKDGLMNKDLKEGKNVIVTFSKDAKDMATSVQIAPKK